jgi:hypothetical protein
VIFDAAMKGSAKAGWQHASQSEQNARAPRRFRRTSVKSSQTPVAKGSASILLAQSGMLPDCFSEFRRRVNSIKSSRVH